MHAIKYLLSKTYRHRFDAEYTKDVCSKFAEEQKQKQDIYEGILGRKL